MTAIDPSQKIVRARCGRAGLRNEYGVFLFAVALAVVSGSGCSFMFVKAPSTTPRQAQPPDCTSSYAAPVVDTVFVGTVGLGVAWGAAQGGPALRGPYDFAHLAPTIALWTGVAAVAASAVYGYTEVGDCRSVRARPTTLSLGPSLPE
jgi:hypothetical protein